ncbi:TraR/DksA family transcriptional regulator [Hyphomonas pacifica]|uniref:Uncharacterized protein n=1 Tax=Hyphomonas pacifica TaxID=1280941 RepID=A0A062U5R0_9PROT|nr:hypothetical protein [Hyphomonas pacifica]KCZ53083.1 hypothetical protein HY2_00730 [Hyphomonas pacifica]RAN36058.1 hypothetical protein HY3_00340 [Hyphomonas pacifica]RAN37430.1 hypothetical protein HY11_09130 [Hyphomonas pacifica]
MKRIGPLFPPAGHPRPATDTDLAPGNRTLRSYALQLARIEAALTRMDAGQYGRCTQCNAPIPIHQLEADPALSACSNCEEPADQVI